MKIKINNHLFKKILAMFLIVLMIAIKTRISKEELDIWAYPVVLLVYAIAAAIFARKQKLAPKIKKGIQRVGL